MDNTEKYGIELDLLITKFKNKINQVKNDIKGLSNQAKANIGEIPIDINYKTLDKDIADLKAKINSLNEDMLEYQKYGYTTSPFYKSYQNDLDKATQKLKILEQAQKDYNNELEKGAVTSTKATVKIGNGFNNLSKKISRYALSLFSLGTIYSLVSRASSAYLSQDLELANKLQSAWVGLGAILAPVIEKIADFIIRVVGYINVFVEALTGVNYIARASAKYMNGLANATKNASKQLASFDEINNLNDQASSTASIGSNPFEAFEDIKLDDTIVEKLQNLAYWLKENWDWIKLVGEALLITFGVSKIAGIVSNIGKVTKALGTGSGLLGTMKTIATFGAIGVTIYVVGNIINDLKEIEELQQKIYDNNIGNHKNLIESSTSAVDLSKQYYSNTLVALDAVKEMAAPWNIITGASSRYKENVDNVGDLLVMQSDKLSEMLSKDELTNEEKLKTLANLYETYGVLGQINSKLDAQGQKSSSINEATKKYEDLLKIIETDLINQGYKQSDIDKYLQNQGISIDRNKTKYDELNGKVSSVYDNVNSIYDLAENNVCTIEFDGDTSKAESKYSSFVSKIGNALTGSISGIFSKVATSVKILGDSSGGLWSKITNLKNLWRFDVGTNYVPSDNLAVVHKGEAIIPKKFNNKEFLGKMASEETNALLVDLIDAVNNIDVNPYVTVKDIGKASVSYINQQNRVQGRSVIK